MIFYMI